MKGLAKITAAELERIRSLRMQMLEYHPFWGHLLLQVEIVPAPELGAMAATDCRRSIWFNPKKTRHLSMPQLGFVLAHELGHIVLLSGQRRRGRNLHLWNCATDYAINRMVAAIPNPARPGSRLYQSPNGTYPDMGEIKILFDWRFEDRIAEAIYERLAKESDERAGTTVTIQLPVPGMDSASIDLPDVQDHGGGIDVHLPVETDETLSDAAREMIESALTAWVAGGRIGCVPGTAQRLLRAQEAPALPWQAVLRRYFGDAVSRMELSYRRPNRRYLDQGLIVPSAGESQLDHVVVALDTSASMHRGILESVAKELKGIAANVNEITLIVADAKVHEVVQGHDLDQWLDRGQVRGGGGTSHVPVFDWIDDCGYRPDLFIGLTDLYTVFPQDKPKFPVLWVVPNRHGRAPFGEIVQAGT